MKISRWGTVALGVAVGALALAGPAAAGHNDVAVEITADGCQVNVTSAWAGDEHLVANTAVVVRHGGAAFSAVVGEPFGVELQPGTTTVEWRVWGGGERDYDDPALDDLPALLEHLDGGGDVLDADAPGVAWHTLAVDGCEPAATEPPATDPPGTDPPATEAPAECVDVNTADADELLQLMHVDADRATQILALRPFVSVDDLGRVDGLAAGGPRLAELVAGGDGFLPLCEIGDEDPAPGVGGEQLPTTGVPAAGLALGAGGLVAAGGVLYLLARRRRVSFTA